jgi:hypothetical protein
VSKDKIYKNTNMTIHRETKNMFAKVKQQKEREEKKMM